MNRKYEKLSNFKCRFALFLSLIVLLTIIYLFNPSKTYGYFNSKDLEVNSVSAIVLDGDTGTVLYEKNKDKKIYPASTLKLLTALIAIEEGNFKDEITVKKTALEGQKNGGVNIALKVGEKITIKDALYATLLHSANDAAIAIGEYIGKDMSSFADKMNKKAKEFGMKNSHFVNSFGFHHKNQYTTTYDLAILGKEVLKNKKLLDIISTSQYTLSETNKRSYPLLIHSTLLLHKGKAFEHENFVGGKTGYIEESGNNLVAIFNKNGKNFVVVMSGPLSKNVINKDAINAFEFVAENYTYKNISSDNKNTLSSLFENEDYPFNILSKADNNKVKAFLPKGYKSKNLKISIKNKLKLPVKKGDIIGYKIAKYKGNVVGKTTIKSSDDFSKFDLFLHKVFVLFKYLIILAVIIFLALYIYKIYLKRKRINKRIYKRNKRYNRYKPYKKEKRLFK